MGRVKRRIRSVQRKFGSQKQRKPQESGNARSPRIRGRSKLTMDLIHDHKLIVADFELLRVKARVPETSGSPSEATLSNRLAQSLHEHFRKEERLLFPLISRYLGQPVCDELRNECAEILKIARSTGEQTSPLQESFARLEMLLQAHIAREENVLFWYLDVRGLTEDAQNAVDFE